MIVNRLNPHHLHNLIESLRSGTFEESIGLTFLADTIYDVTAVMELIDHLFDHSHIILQIRMKKGKFDFEDFLESMKQMRSTGRLSSIVGLPP